jgi:DinB superfamily
MEAKPARDEAAEYYFKYIDQVPDGDVCAVLEAQLGETLAFFRNISEDQSLHRYATGKWTIRQVLSHVNDTERVFTFRALWFGRGFEEPMPKFDQEMAIAAASADERPLASHVDEFRGIRTASVALFRGLPLSAWSRRGLASGHPVTVRALAYITAGHLAHHLKLLRERYL